MLFLITLYKTLKEYMNLTIVAIVFLLIAGFLVLVYSLGKNNKEKEIINNNSDLKKKYANNKKHINNSNALSDKLQKGNY